MLRRAARVALLATVSFAVLSGGARAQVVEPNGVTVPRPPPADEISIQAYFDTEMEPIDAIAEASAEPGAFSPLCDFTATIVLAEALSADGLAWYNAPADPTERPEPLFQIVPESARVTGQIFTGSDIRDDPNYRGGLIGFALTQNGRPIYYSEYQRNAYCSGCSMPGHWKMMLAYRSVRRQNAYYLGFEDWAGADASSWGDNDGDFQDKLFLVTGITCAGGGEPCDTGEAGVCAAGLTECTTNGAPVCRRQQGPRDETCNNLDEDCDGIVDDGDLCPTDRVCVRGQCVARCNTGEFSCPATHVCGAEGYCIERSCAAVTCEPGLACRAGTCVGVCQGVVCPLGQVCQLDRCVDPCADVSCPIDTFCQQGVCVGNCTCNGCPSGQDCAPDGRCHAPGCAGVTCPAGQGCRDGACVPACDGAVCPGAAQCADGICGAPAMGGAGGTGAVGGAGVGGTIIIAGGTGGAAMPTGGGMPDAGAGPAPPIDGSSSEIEGGPPPGSHSCACRSARRSGTGLAAVAAPFCLGFCLCRSRRRSRPS